MCITIKSFMIRVYIYPFQWLIPSVKVFGPPVTVL